MEVEGEEEGKDEEQVEGQKKEKGEDIAVHIFAFFLSNDSSLATVDLVVANYSRGRDEAHQFSKLAGRRQTTLRLLAPNLARAVRPKIRLWSHTRT